MKKILILILLIISLGSYAQTVTYTPHMVISGTGYNFNFSAGTSVANIQSTGVVNAAYYYTPKSIGLNEMVISNNTANNICYYTVGSDSSISITFNTYSVYSEDASKGEQEETGIVGISGKVVNGVFTPYTITPVILTQNRTAGTMTVTWSVTYVKATSKATLVCTVASDLTTPTVKISWTAQTGRAGIISLN
jgi:hypothetical protein